LLDQKRLLRSPRDIFGATYHDSALTIVLISILTTNLGGAHQTEPRCPVKMRMYVHADIQIKKQEMAKTKPRDRLSQTLSANRPVAGVSGRALIVLT
jgi:hypothetical protein